jgi:hypothetical protein
MIILKGEGETSNEFKTYVTSSTYVEEIEEEEEEEMECIHDDSDDNLYQYNNRRNSGKREYDSKRQVIHIIILNILSYLFII